MELTTDFLALLLGVTTKGSGQFLCGTNKLFTYICVHIFTCLHMHVWSGEEVKEKKDEAKHGGICLYLST
jgi:hypothetical protein